MNGEIVALTNSMILGNMGEMNYFITTFYHFLRRTIFSQLSLFKECYLLTEHKRMIMLSIWKR